MRRIYEVILFSYSDPLEPIPSFLGNSGKLETIRGDYDQLIAWIETTEGTRIYPGQFLLKDGRGKILSFDLTTFYTWFEVWQNT